MTCYTFMRMPATFQLTWVLKKGTYLARRREEQVTIALYYLPYGGRGFFAEVGRGASQQGAFVMRSFSNSTSLEDYAQYVRLPEL
jgi:hypothetical protein